MRPIIILVLIFVFQFVCASSYASQNIVNHNINADTFPIHAHNKLSQLRTKYVMEIEKFSESALVMGSVGVIIGLVGRLSGGVDVLLTFSLITFLLSIFSIIHAGKSLRNMKTDSEGINIKESKKKALVSIVLGIFGLLISIPILILVLKFLLFP